MRLADGFLTVLAEYIKRGVISESPNPRRESDLKSLVYGMQELMKDSEGCFVVMTIYFERLISRHNMLVNQANMSRLLFVAGVMAIKIYDDFASKNSYYAKLSGLSGYEFNELERSFLNWIEYELAVQDHEYCFFYQKLCKI